MKQMVYEFTTEEPRWSPECGIIEPTVYAINLLDYEEDAFVYALDNSEEVGGWIRDNLDEEEYEKNGDLSDTDLIMEYEHTAIKYVLDDRCFLEMIANRYIESIKDNTEDNMEEISFALWEYEPVPINERQDNGYEPDEYYKDEKTADKLLEGY